MWDRFSKGDLTALSLQSDKLTEASAQKLLFPLVLYATHKWGNPWYFGAAYHRLSCINESGEGWRCLGKKGKMIGMWSLLLW